MQEQVAVIAHNSITSSVCDTRQSSHVHTPNVYAYYQKVPGIYGGFAHDSFSP